MRIRLLRAGVLLLVCLSVGLFSACNKGAASGVIEVPEGSSDVLDSVSGGESGTESASVPTPDIAPPSAPDSAFSMSSLLAGLDDYTGYQQDMMLAFEGFDGVGRPESWRIARFSEVDSAFRAFSVTIVTEGFEDSDGLPSSLKMSRIDGSGYLYMPGTGCVSGPDIGSNFAGDIRPEMIVGEIVEALALEQDLNIDGALSHLYGFTETSSSVLSGLPLSVDGQVFVAAEGGYVTRLTLRAEGEGDLLGDGRKRSGIYRLQVDNLPTNDSFEVEPPPECTVNLPYPVMEGALEITSLEEIVGYKIPMFLGDVVEFYQMEMPELGWIESAESTVFDDIAILVYQQDVNEVTIQITSEQDENLVSVFISP